MHSVGAVRVAQSASELVDGKQSGASAGRARCRKRHWSDESGKRVYSLEPVAVRRRNRRGRQWIHWSYGTWGCYRPNRTCGRGWVRWRIYRSYGSYRCRRPNRPCAIDRVRWRKCEFCILYGPCVRLWSSPI